MKRSKLMFGFIILLSILLPIFIGVGCGDDDKPNNSSVDIPDELVGIWWFTSGTNNGTPISSFSEISFAPTAVSGKVALHDNGTWNSAEYDAGDNQVYSRSGTFTVSADSIIVTATVDNGVPVSPPTVGAWGSYTVVGDVLTLSYIGEATTIITIYTRE